MQSLPLWAYILEQNIKEANRQNYFTVKGHEGSRQGNEKQKGMGVGPYIKWEKEHPEKPVRNYYKTETRGIRKGKEYPTQKKQHMSKYRTLRQVLRTERKPCGQNTVKNGVR